MILVSLFIPVASVQAAGYITMTIASDHSLEFTSSYGVWTTVTHQDTATSTGNDLCLVDYDTSGTANFYRTMSSIIRFNIDTAPDISQIASIKVRLYCLSKSTFNAPTFDAPYISFYDCKADNGGAIASTDIDNFNDHPYYVKNGKNRITNYYSFSDFSPGNWIEFTVPVSDWDNVLNVRDGHYSYMDLVTEQHALDNIPNGVWKGNAGYQLAFGAVAGGIPAQYPQLVFSYAPEATPPVFTYDTNDAVDIVLLGDEVADNITLATLSCMYANEDLQFNVWGDSGAPITLKLVDSTGAILDSLTDSIRVLGHYHWIIDSLASTYSGFVQVKETTYGLTSPWVRIEPTVSPTEANLNIYAVKTDHPQYTEPFSTYVVQRGDYMVVHWKTNINPGSDNMSDISLNIYSNGNAVTPAYSETLADLETDYYQGTAANQAAGIPWRFALFTPKAIQGTNLYGGLVNDLSLDFVPDYKGYLQPMLLSGATGEITVTHSSYWYLTGPGDGITISRLKSQYSTTDEIGFKITVGRECQVAEKLQYLEVSIVELGASLATYVKEGENIFYIDAIETEGDYTLQIKLSNTGISSYEYIYQLPLTISNTAVTPPATPTPPTADNIWDWIKDLMARYHFDSTGGHWLLILIGMGISLLIGSKTKHSTVGLVMALLVFGLGIVVGWIDKWWIVLLALGAGFTIWQFIRSRASGSGAG
jgi:hypothetical protein